MIRLLPIAVAALVTNAVPAPAGDWLRGGLDPAEPRTDVAADGIGTVATFRDGAVATIDTDGAEVAFPGKVATFRLGGRLQTDFGTARLRGTPIDGPFDGRLDSRRAWLEAYLTLFGSFEFAFQYDFANRTTPIQDAVAAYRGFDGLVLSVGNMKEPFSLGQLISDNNTLFAERALSDVFAPARRFGGSAGGSAEGVFITGERRDAVTLTAGIFGGNANEGIGDNGVAGTARATWSLRGDADVLHLGAAVSHRELARSGRSFAYATEPESILFRTALVDTGTIADARAVTLAGLEAAYQAGPVRVQAEQIWSRVERGTRAGGDLSFSGGYVEGGWTVNGNGRPYAVAPDYGTTFAVFGSPKLDDAQRVTRGGVGLFELAARISWLDLASRDVGGGRQVNYGFGLNWYPESFVKVVANYVRAHADASPVASGPVDADIFVGRVQVFW